MSNERKYQVTKDGKPIDVDDKIYAMMVQIFTDDSDDEDDDYKMCQHCEDVLHKDEMYHEDHFEEDQYYCNEHCFFWHMRALKG